MYSTTIKSTLKLSSACLLLLCSTQGWAQLEYRKENYRDVRMLGRGNAGMAAIRDGNAMFYNPAALGAVNSFSFVPLNPVAGGNQNIVTGAADLMSLTSGNTSLSDKFSPFLGKPLGAQAYFFPNFSIPGLVLGFYDSMDTYVSYRNPVYPELNINYKNDYGYVLGTGFELFKGFSVGASLRYVKRRIISETFMPDTLFSVDSDFLQTLQRRGTGYGVSLGGLYVHQIDPVQSLSLGVHWEDIRNTKFITTVGAPDPGYQMENLSAGVAYTINSSLIDIIAAVDMRHIRDLEMSYSKKIHMGVEANMPLLSMRAGLYQGYWTLGLSISPLPFIELDLTSYAEEMDSFAGIRSNRIWLIGLRTGIDISGQKVSRTRQKIRLEDI